MFVPGSSRSQWTKRGQWRVWACGEDISFYISFLHSVAFKILGLTISISLSVYYFFCLRGHVGCQVLLVLMENLGRG